MVSIAAVDQSRAASQSRNGMSWAASAGASHSLMLVTGLASPPVAADSSAGGGMARSRPLKGLSALPAQSLALISVPLTPTADGPPKRAAIASGVGSRMLTPTRGARPRVIQ